MKNRKINLDRPQLNADEIMTGKNFESVVRNHQIMSKPFYKQNWFFGTTGIASLGLIIGGTLAFQNSTENLVSTDMLNTDAPPNLTVPDNNFIVMNARTEQSFDDFAKKTIVINLENITPIEETPTLDNPTETNVIESLADVATDNAEEIITAEVPEIENTNVVASNPSMDINPRISNKMGGSITRNELLDNKGITTEGDVNIIHFELHLIDGLGGKVFAEEGNQLNEDMKDALESVGQGETIYFENIRGKVKNGREVRLNPLRYVLMN
ncbi:MAG: hypothetical protein GQ574_20725 [Crocinitomix sp.]|nr:hypothetical protein [Crocinitomix sp.]